MRRTAGRALVVVALTAATIGAAAGTASAGEITRGGRSLATVPNPDYTPGDPESSPYVVHAASICAYSGLNDDWVNAQNDNDPTNDTTYSHVQNPAEAPPGVPGFACSPGRFSH